MKAIAQTAKPKERINCMCKGCKHVWTAFYMPASLPDLARTHIFCPMCLGRKCDIVRDKEVQPLEVQAQILLARAIDAMCRTDPNGVSPAEWDAIVSEGTALLQRAVLA